MKKKHESHNDFAHILRIIHDLSDNQNTPDIHKNELVEEELLANRDSVSRELFFICKNCKGALIQYTFCCICKKTVSRICVKCGMIKSVGDHNVCLRTVFLDLEKNPKAENV